MKIKLQMSPIDIICLIPNHGWAIIDCNQTAWISDMKTSTCTGYCQRCEMGDIEDAKSF